MKKNLALALSSLLMMSCSVSRSSYKVCWIEDKPGPTLQGHNVFPSVPDSLWNVLDLQQGVPSSMSCLLLETDGKKILIDAGLGAQFSQLTQTLHTLGVASDDLRLIYITHMHADHIGGLLKAGKAAFPNAELYINRIEADAWQTMGAEKNAQQMQVLEAYRDHLHLFEAGDKLPGDVTTIAAYGHTPGHTLFQKSDLLVIGDLIHGAALQMQHPEYCPFFDMDPDTAAASRKRILDYARKNNLTMYGMHLPSPGYVK